VNDTELSGSRLGSRNIIYFPLSQYLFFLEPGKD
jgi:hypothetical protein